MTRDDWRERLKTELPRAEIPLFLVELQALVSALRRYRDDLVVPEVDDVRPLLTPRLVAHAELALGYMTDDRYASVVRAAMAAEREAGAAD